jgi:hypothetical protein
MLAALGGLVIVLSLVISAQRHHIKYLNDQLGYARVRRGVGDVNELQRLRRRLDGLLRSPRFYLRARRMVAPLETTVDDLLAELELIEELERVEVGVD